MSKWRPLDADPPVWTQCARCKKWGWLGSLQRSCPDARDDECPKCFYNRVSSDPEPPGRQTALQEVEA